MTRKARLSYLDSIKGLLIILVIIGHAIQFSLPDYELNFVFRFIYSFHMPLFFFVSGFLANRGKFNSNVIAKRAYQLLIPFVVWALITPFIYNGSFDINRTLQTLIYPDRGLWFLYNLFIYSALFNIAEWLEEKYKIKHIVTIGGFTVGLLLLMFLLHTKFNCSQLCYHLPFFAFGYYYKAEPEKFNISLIILSIAFAISMPFWVTNGEPLFYQYINLGSALSYVYKYFVSIVGMLLFYKLGEKYLNTEIPLLQKIGISTLGIYAVQFSIIYYSIRYLGIEQNVIKIFTVSAMTVPISYVSVVTIRKIKYVRLLLIGEK